MVMTIRGEALRWWRMGISPIPLMLKSKRPMVKWKPWEAVLPPMPILAVWFKHHRNLGIVIRKGLCVLDFDTPHGYWWWRKEVREELSESYTVKTRRGWHVYFWLEEPFTNIAKMEKGGEIRGKGILVVPPSVHASGKSYTTWKGNPIWTVDSVESLGVEWQVVEKPRREMVPYGEGYFEGDGVVNRIKTEIQIVNYLDRFTRVKWDGTAWMAVCPFHRDSNPSLQVHPEEGWCYCHAPHCMAHRRCDIVNVAEFIWGRTSAEVVKILAQELD